MRRDGGEPVKLGGERLRTKPLPPPPREGEELTERCRDEELRGEALELRMWCGEPDRLQAPCWAEGRWWSEEPRAPCISWARQVSRSESPVLPARMR